MVRIHAAADRRGQGLIGAMVMLSLLAAAAPAEPGSASKKRLFPKLTAGTKPAEDRTLETRVTWARSVDEAADKAEQEGKLVFVIHVSGDFEQPEFT